MSFNCHNLIANCNVFANKKHQQNDQSGPQRFLVCYTKNSELTLSIVRSCHFQTADELHDLNVDFDNGYKHLQLCAQIFKQCHVISNNVAF